MKRFFYFLLMTLPLMASSNFWETIIDTEKSFYRIDMAVITPSKEDKDRQKPAQTENNETKKGAAMESRESDLSKFADEKIARFNLIVSLMKERPYEVKATKNPYFDPAQARLDVVKLKNRIAVNKEYGYMLAVDRDEIALLELQTREKIYEFFKDLADRWTDLDRDSLQKYYEKYRQWIRSLDLNRFAQIYANAKKSKDKISLQIVENYEKLRMHYLFFSDFIEFLTNNPSMMEYRSLASFFRLDLIIDQINDIDLFSKVNLYLRHIHTDVGRLLIFSLIMLFSWGMAYLLYFKLYRFLKEIVQAEYDESDEVLLRNLDDMRRPFFLLIIILGLRVGLEVLLHPMPLPENLAFIFYAIVLGTIAYVLIVVIDSLFFDYMIKRGELQNRQLRQELVNLILSILKAIIIIVVIAMLLVRMGVNIAGLLASLGIGGLAVALAAQSTLSNFFGLLKIIFDNSFSQGDWIETKDVEGTVVEIGFISTIVRTFDNALITVPNATLANSPLKNWSKRSVGRRIKMHIGVTYGSSREAVMKAVEEIEAMLVIHPGIATPQKIEKKEIVSRHRRESKLVSLEDKYGVKSTLLVYLDEFADSSINILVYCFSKSVVWQEWLEVKQDVLLKIWEILDRHGLSFAFPSESIYFDEENIDKSFTPLLLKGKSSVDVTKN